MKSDKKSLHALQIGELIAEKPIIQGGMGVGVSRSSLAGAVAAEGGVGIISTAVTGQRLSQNRLRDLLVTIPCQLFIGIRRPVLVCFYELDRGRGWDNPRRI